jgi:outer membrane receptor protein involved in Fe transport
VGFRSDLFAAQNHFYVGAYVNNAFNKTVLSFSFGTPFSAFMTGTLQAPREFGIRTGMHF